MADAEYGLVIFDCDGVLVDSEPLSISVLVQAMRDSGVEIDEEGAYKRFLGKSLATLIDTLETEFNVFASQRSGQIGDCGTVSVHDRQVCGVCGSSLA